MWSHVIIVSQTTVLLIENRFLLYLISLNRNIIYLLMQFLLYFQDILLIMLLCVYVRMSVSMYVGAYAFNRIIFHYSITPT